MTKYVSVQNQITEVIDDTFFNIAFIRKVRKYFTPPKPPSFAQWYHFDIDISDVESPVVALSSICAASYYRSSPKTLTICVGALTGQNIPNAISKLNDPKNYIDIYVYGQPKDNTPNIGMKIWGGDGKLIFDANHKYMRPYRVHSEDTLYTPNLGSGGVFRNNKKLLFDVGRKYAAIPLCRTFSIQAEYISTGWETYWMADVYSSSCAIDGAEIYITSGLVDKVEDTSVVSTGACRHHYMFVDVTGY